MANWKELGEVPDSEDEDGFDVDDLDHYDVPKVHAARSEEATSHNTDLKTKKSIGDGLDIWDIPDSPTSPRHEKSTTPFSRLGEHNDAFSSVHDIAASTVSSPLSSPPSDDDLPSLDNLMFEHALDDSQIPNRQIEDTAETFQADEISESYVELTTPTPNFDAPPARDQPHGTGSHSREISTLHLQSQELGHDAQQLKARQAAVRYERSLRPRKPIQEHPYLLENAHYSSILKRHGVKPLRAVIEAERRRREATTHDDEFQEESQESGMLENSEESQFRDFAHMLEEADSPDLPSSSLRRTSPIDNGLGPSNPASSQGNTDNTSVADQDLPSLQDIAARPHLSKSLKGQSKRATTPPRSAARKRPRRDLIDSDSIEPSASGNRNITQVSPNSPPSRRQNDARSRGGSPFDLGSPPILRRLHPFSASPESSSKTPEPEVLDGMSNNMRSDIEEVNASNSDGESSGSASDGGAEVVNKVSRRIRGVLPASWLRIDMQAGHGQTQKALQKNRRDRSPELEQRRGLAQRRVAPQHSNTVAFPLFDDSDEETRPSGERTTDEVFHHQTRLVLEPTMDSTFPDDSSDNASVVEDNRIDHMVSGAKRQQKLPDAIPRNPKRTKTSTGITKFPTQKAARQPRIDRVWGNDVETKGGSSSGRPPVKTKSRPRHTGSKNRKHNSHKTSKPASSPRRPPELSVLDVIEPDAPQFLKIAARAARRKPGQGRSSPRRKLIQLATRRDHIDVASVMNDWRAGSIQPRSSVSAAKRAARPRNTVDALTRISGRAGPVRDTSRSTKAPPRKLTKQVSAGGSVLYHSQSGTTQPSRRPRQVDTGQHAVSQKPTARSASFMRMAQLETDGTERPRTQLFHSTKRFLDRIYRQHHRDGSPTPSIAATLDDVVSEVQAHSVTEQLTTPTDQQTVTRPPMQPKLRRRKQTRPRRIDTQAPEFRHANDPLPTVHPQIDFSAPAAAPEGDKLQGLGPYGTYYTHHFEVFTLDPRVYFHESTLIGSGVFGAIATRQSLNLTEPRPHVSCVLGENALRWGQWNAQVSSELGIVLDLVAEQVELCQSGSDHSHNAVATQAMDFVAGYVKNSLSFESATDAKLFALRVHEAIRGINSRISISQQADSNQDAQRKLTMMVYDRLLLVCLLAIRVCQDDSSLMQEQFQMEALLKDLATTSASMLMAYGTSTLKKTYEDLHMTHFRDRGLRDDTPWIHSWVTLMKILDLAHIPRATFWDVAGAAIASSEIISSVDVKDHERAWEDMFTLLPLVEFNDAGVIVPGQRHNSITDGWALPQKLLKRIFELYKDNPRQSPSFNNYCRALVGRCHYLVEQWGWRRSAGVIGVIFDFFGSQDLAHLRNEEVYRSPRFLEELGGRPSLDIEPEDRCFHVFLKLVGLSIQRLRLIEATKDIRNLVARTVPNHNRQYLKEQRIHQRDLAALRNHHDLLVTLFWSAPRELRPSVTLIERLVEPATSHKEACLTNLRAWNQLARFIVASGEATTSFKPMIQWRNKFFQQIMFQFDSVAADIHQQVLDMSKEMNQSVSPELINDMISKNKKAVMDVLHMSMVASADVMQHTPDLEAAMFALNAVQLQGVLKHFTMTPPDLDWSILKTCLSTLETYLTRIDNFKENEESQQSESQILDSAQADDALLTLDNEISPDYFSMARCVLPARKTKGISGGAATDMEDCKEKLVVLAARMGARFVTGGLMRLSEMFKLGRRGLFNGPPQKLDLNQRKYFVLFFSTLLGVGFTDFSDLDFGLEEVWALSIVKPRQFLRYETHFAEQLRLEQKKFIPDGVMGLAINPDYNTNRDLFQFAISSMRRGMRDAGPGLRKILISGHTKTLKLVMDQMRSDLHALVQDTVEHPAFVVFVRDIVSLIRAHGSEICMVDDFFYQVSREYSPSTQDPQLQVAGMISYGLRLTEGDSRVVQQLFYFLFNNFKLAVINDKLDEEVVMLQRGMENSGILTFVLGTMLPAIIRVMVTTDLGFCLLDVYTNALQRMLESSTPVLAVDSEGLSSLLSMMKAIERWLSTLAARESHWEPECYYIGGQLVAILNLMWPRLEEMMADGADGPTWNELISLLDKMDDLICSIAEYLVMRVDDPIAISFIHLERGHEVTESLDEMNGDPVKQFRDIMEESIRRDWITLEATPQQQRRVTVQAPGKGTRGPSSTQGLQGVVLPEWDGDDEDRLASDMYAHVQMWCWWWNRLSDKPERNDANVRRALNVIF